MDNYDITSAQYFLNIQNENTLIKATINGVVMDVPLDPGNRHYDEIMKQVEAGRLTIADVD